MVIPKVVAATIMALSSLNPAFSVKFADDRPLSDVAAASRYYGPNYQDTTACTINLDEDNLQQTIYWADRKSIPISEKVLRAFILLHEAAHCYDTVDAPAGMDPIKWREFAADEFAATELYAQKFIDLKGYQTLISFRNSLSATNRPLPMVVSLKKVAEGKLEDTTVARFKAALEARNQQLNSEATK